MLSRKAKDSKLHNFAIPVWMQIDRIEVLNKAGNIV